MQPPQNPAGEFIAEENIGCERRSEFISIIENAPVNLRKTVARLSEEQLDARYRNWTIRQIAHHLADSHVNSYVRFKWALTEEQPTIKAYYEDRWVALEDSRTGNIQAPLALLNQENVTCIVYPAKSWSPHQARPDQNRIRRKKIPTPSAKWIAERQKL